MMTVRALIVVLLSSLAVSGCVGLVGAMGLMPKEAGGGYQKSGRSVTFWPDLSSHGMDPAGRAFESYGLPGADSETFVTLSRSPWYGKDKARVYYGPELIAGANPATFRILPEEDYSTDGVSVFYQARRLERADPATIDFSGRPFVTDRTGVFFKSERMSGAVAPVSRLEPGDYARDAAGAVFYLQHLVENGDPIQRYVRLDLCDPPTFEILGGGFAADSKCVHFESKQMPQVDRATFELLGMSWAKDRNAVFKFDTRAPGADPSTAEIVVSLDTQRRDGAAGAFFMRDKTGCRLQAADHPRSCPSDVITLEAYRQSPN